MTRNLKALGLALVAVFALSAVASAAAQAESKFMAAEYPVTIHGSQTTKHIFKYGGNEVTCENAEFNGSATAASSEIEIEPAYTNCHVNVLGSILPATVTIGTPPAGKKCYLFKITGTDPTDPTNLDKAVGTVTIQCEFIIHIYASAKEHEEGKTSLCTLAVSAPQGPFTGVTFENNTATGHVNVNASISGIAVTRTGSTLCGAASGTATYTGNTAMEGKNSLGNADAITVEME